LSRSILSGRTAALCGRIGKSFKKPARGAAEEEQEEGITPGNYWGRVSRVPESPADIHSAADAQFGKRRSRDKRRVAARSEVDIEAQRVGEKTAQLKALRLAKEAAGKVAIGGKAHKPKNGDGLEKRK
jgi:hypothetical protein